MKSAILFFGLFIFQCAFSQNQADEAFSAFNFQKNSSQRILVEKASVRSTPELNSQILDSLDVNHEIKILDRSKELTKIGERDAPWFKISYKKGGVQNEGFVWGGNIALENRRYKDVLFLFGIAGTQKIKDKDFDSYHDGLIAKIIAIKGDKAISERTFEVGNSGNLLSHGLKIIENKNLKNVDFIIKTYVSGEACAIPTYDQFFFWTEGSFYKLPRLMSVSDAGVFAHIENYVFPNQKNVNANTVLKITQESQTDEKERTKTSKKSKTYFWDGKSLK